MLMLISILLISILLTSCFIPFKGFSDDGNGAATSTSEALSKAEDFTLLDLNNNKVSLSDFRGKVVVLNFWATWCPPCIAEAPDLVEVSNAYKDKGVQFIGVSDDDVSALEKFVNDYGIEYPILLDLSLIHISEPTRLGMISYAVFCL